MSDERLEQVLDTINRVIDLSEEKIPLKNEKYKATADLEIEKTKRAWQEKYCSAVADLQDLFTQGGDEMVRMKIKQKYGLE